MGHYWSFSAFPQRDILDFKAMSSRFNQPLVLALYQRIEYSRQRNKERD